jgi:imidazolonepropionase-like amidohydrolase
LSAATKNVDEYFKAKDKFGFIVAGHRADLALLDANPLSDISNVSKRTGVMLRGRWMPEAEIQAGPAKIIASSK